ncbi:hypothetical protein Aperf_G00000017311 [Anoplocephala perfoliata]
MSETKTHSFSRGDKLNRRSEVPHEFSPEAHRFDSGISPISPRESPSPSNSAECSISSRHSRSHHHRHHNSRRHHRISRDRDRRRETPSSLTSNSRRRRGDDLKDAESERDSDRKYRRVDRENSSGDRHLRKERGSSRTKDSRKDHRRRRSVESEVRQEADYKRSHGRKFADVRESRHRADREERDRSFKRDRRRSGSRQSPNRLTPSFESKQSPQITKNPINTFATTLLKPLLKETTSDTELEDLLPVEILSGEMAKRSMPIVQSSDQSKRISTLQNQPQSQPQIQASQIQSQEVKAESSSQLQVPIGGPEQKQPIDEGESRFDRFLSNLSHRLQEKEQEEETWGDANEVDFSDILMEEDDTIRLAASAASLKPRELLEACLSTPWHTIERRTEDEDADKMEKKTDDEDKEDDPFDLISLLSSNISRRYLDDDLVKELEERGITLSAASVKDSPSVNNFKSRMVPGVFEEKEWRQNLLGVIHI